MSRRLNMACIGTYVLSVRVRKGLACVAIVLSSLLLLESCSQKSLDPDPGSPDVMVTFLASKVADNGQEEQKVDTKTDVVTSLSSFSVYCSTGTAGSTETKKFCATFTDTGETPTTYTGGKYWPTYADYVAAPYHFYASNAPVSAFTETVSGPTIAVDNTTDVVCAVFITPVFEAVNNLEFKHIFARVGEVTVSAPASGVYTVSNLSIKIDECYSGGTYNLYSGNGCDDHTGWTNGLSYKLTDTTIATATGSNSNDIYVIPGQVTLTASYDLELAAASYSEHIVKTADIVLKKGCVNSIATTLPEGDLEAIKFDVSVSSWPASETNLYRTF